jgi:transcriptional regulator with XRE-family HTH domain
MIYGQIVKMIMKEQNVTQKELARRLNTSERKISDILNSDNVRIYDIKNICDVLNIDIKRVFCNTDSEIAQLNEIPVEYIQMIRAFLRIPAPYREKILQGINLQIDAVLQLSLQ